MSGLGRQRRCLISSKNIHKSHDDIWSDFAAKMAGSNVILFQDIFRVHKLIKEEEFDKVTRVEAKSENYDMFLQLDVNTDIYSICFGDRFVMALAWTLNLDGTPYTGHSVQEKEKESLINSYELVMRGEVYRITQEKEWTPNDREGMSSSESATKGAKMEINVSFGRLLMMLKGDPSYMPKFELNQKPFLLVKKLRRIVP